MKPDRIYYDGDRKRIVIDGLSYSIEHLTLFQIAELHNRRSTK